MNMEHPIHSPPLSTVLPSFFAAAQADQSRREATVIKYREAGQFFIRTIGDLPVDGITVDTFRELKQKLLERGSGPSHTNSIIYAMKKILEHCKQNLCLPVSDLAPLKVLKIPRRAVVHLTQDDVTQFMDAIKVHHRAGTVHLPGLCFRALAEVLAGTGMRISEALGLDVNAINWRDHEARIIGKGGKERKIVFSDRAIRWLKRYLEYRTDSNPPLFVSARTGQRLALHVAQRMCRSALQRSGLKKKVTLHVLRHTFATALLRNGCPIGHIQGLLGHERLETTCRYYLGLLDENDLKRAHERFLDW